jgi:hypothetical protein
MTSTPEPRNRRALLVGIDRYPLLTDFAQLDGATADAKAMAQTLTGRFGFAEERVRLLLDEAATRNAILAALDRLVEETETDDVVVFHFSGHGSQMPDREGDEADGQDETLVPYDGGREPPHPNRDISDDEIYDWLLRLTAKTSYVTLIFDCCHSATLNRDGFGDKVRGIPPEERKIRDLPPSSERALRAAAAYKAQKGGGPVAKGAGGWLPWDRRWTLLAGCAAHQESHEMRPPGLIGTRHGVMTYFLVQELQNLRPGETWRDVYERILPQVTRESRTQEPQLEGVWDREIFGAGLFEPLRFIPVQGRCRDGRVLLGAGAACGLTVGSLWEVYPQGAREDAPGTALGVVEITGVSAFTSDGKVVREAQPGAIGRGCRAVERSHAYGMSQRTVDFVLPSRWKKELQTLEESIESSPLLTRMRGSDADVRVYLLEPRRRALPQDPVPELGALDEPKWAVVGRDGRLVLPMRRAASLDSVFDLAENLEKLARFHHALALDNPTSALRGKVDLILQRLTAGGPMRAREEEEGRPVFHEKDLLALEVRNTSGQELYFYVVDFGLSGKVSLVYPPQGAREPMTRDVTSLSIGTRLGQELPLTMPWDFPFADPGSPASGLEFIKLFATTEPVDFGLLFQDSYRKHEKFLPGVDDNPLGRLLSQAMWGTVYRGKQSSQAAVPQDWTTVTRSFVLRRR